MSENALPVSVDCCTPCIPAGTSSTPGPQGPAGADGTNGADGDNAWTTHADGSGVMPAGDGSGDTVTLNTTSSTGFIVVGGLLYVQTWGWMRVVSVPTTTSVELSNPEDSTTGDYSENAASGTTLAAGLTFSMSGPQGPAGVVDGNLYLLKSANLSDLANFPVSRGNLGLGSAALYTIGVGNGQVPYVDDVGSINLNEFAVGTGAGLRGDTPTQARVTLGLGTAAVEDVGTADGDVPQVDNVAGLTNGDVVFATATGVETLSAAAARAALGIASSSLEMVLFRQTAGVGVGGGALAAGNWEQVPFTVMPVDTGGNGSLAGGQMTLSAGTYRYNYILLTSSAGSFRGRLYNITAAAVIASSYSTNGNVADLGINTEVEGCGRFTLGVSSILELQAYTTELSADFGTALSLTGTTEYYSYIEFYKE